MTRKIHVNFSEFRNVKCETNSTLFFYIHKLENDWKNSLFIFFEFRSLKMTIKIQLNYPEFRSSKMARKIIVQIFGIQKLEQWMSEWVNSKALKLQKKYNINFPNSGSSNENNLLLDSSEFRSFKNGTKSSESNFPNLKTWKVWKIQHCFSLNSGA